MKIKTKLIITGILLAITLIFALGFYLNSNSNCDFKILDNGISQLSNCVKYKYIGVK